MSVSFIGLKPRTKLVQSVQGVFIGLKKPATNFFSATVEMLADELNHHHSSQGLIKGLALSSGAFIFYVFNYLIHV
jgi:hypothetical protein